MFDTDMYGNGEKTEVVATEHDFVKALTDYIFIKDEPVRSDVIFIPGCTYYPLPEYAAALYASGLADVIIPSGRYSTLRGHLTLQSPQDKYRFDFPTEAEFFAHVLTENGVPEEAVLCETKSEYTCQNAFFTAELVAKAGIKADTALLVCKSFHARRAYSYYKWAFPDTDIRVCPVDTVGESADDWFETQKGRDRIMGELKRIADYFGSYPTDRHG